MKHSDSLKRKKEFRFTYRVGKSVPGRHCILIYTKNRQRTTKVGFSVSKKLGGAVQRNRIKRRLRETITPILPGIRKGYNIIFIAREPLINAPFCSIGASLLGQLKKANLINEESF